MSCCLNSIYLYNKNCNLRCRHCWIDPGCNNTVQGELRFEEVKDLFLQGKALGMSGVKLSGGEPLLFSYIRPLIRFLGEEKLKIVLETNGTLVDDEIAAALSEAHAFVSVSLDGSNEKIHNLLRLSSNSFRDAIRGIEVLERHGIAPQIIFSIHRKNQDNLGEMIAFARSLGADSLKINLIRGVGRAADLDGNGELTSTADFIRFHKDYQAGGAQDFNVLFDIPPAFRSITDINTDGCNTCGIKGVLGVLSDGSASICGIGNLKEELVFGNIRRRSLAEILEKTELIRFIREEIPGKLEGICGRCMLKGMCLGKCIANTYYATGSFTSGNLFCEEAAGLGLFPETRLL